MKRPLALMALIACAPGLGGCVAAIPIASAVLVGESSMSRGRAEDNARIATAPPPPFEVASASTVVEPEPVAEPAPIAVTEPEPVSEAVKLVDTPLGKLAVGQGPQELPAATPPVEPPVSMAAVAPVAPVVPAPKESAPAIASRAPGAIGPIAPRTGADPVYDALFANVTRIAQRLPSSRERRYSAILKDPRSIKPTRTECRIGKTAVLIDLDPANGIAPLGEGVTASPRLTRILEGLRAQDVEILWLSSHTLDDAVELRNALTRSGLDPTRLDPLFLPRFPRETKATRQADAAREFCVVAMLGDAWTDFDPTFQDAAEPSTAAALDALVGEAWFLAPPPLDPKG